MAKRNQAWFDRLVRKIRSADSEEDIKEVLREDAGLAPESHEGERREDVHDEGGSHTHIYLPGASGGSGGGGGAARMGGDDDPDMGEGGGSSAPATTEGRVDALEARLESIEDMLQQLLDGDDDGDEDDVQLEDPKTGDARMFKMRRGSKIRRARDEELPVPERRPEEMIGETDLPGIEDLDKTMSTGDKLRRMRARDSVDAEPLWQDLIASVEVLAPGTRVPTFDARLPLTRTASVMHQQRFKAMDCAMQEAEIAAVIKDTIGIVNRDQLRTLSPDSMKMAFNASVAAVRQRRNGGMVASHVADGTGQAKPSKVPSLAEMNKAKNEFWANRDGFGNGAIRH